METQATCSRDIQINDLSSFNLTHQSNLSILFITSARL